MKRNEDLAFRTNRDYILELQLFSRSGVVNGFVNVRWPVFQGT